MHRTSTSALQEAQKVAKRTLALMLFLGILLGGGTAAFSLLAAAIGALSNLSAYPQPVTVTVPATAPATTSGGAGGTPSVNLTTSENPSSSSANSSSTAPGSGESGWNSTAPTTGTSAVNRLNNEISHMHSPIMGMVDSGGIAVGNKVQNAFGHVLSGLIKALFLEQK